MNDRAAWAGSEDLHCDAILRRWQRPEDLLMRYVIEPPST